MICEIRSGVTFSIITNDNPLNYVVFLNVDESEVKDYMFRKKILIQKNKDGSFVAELTDDPSVETNALLIVKDRIHYEKLMGEKNVKKNIESKATKEQFEWAIENTKNPKAQKAMKEVYDFIYGSGKVPETEMGKTIAKAFVLGTYFPHSEIIPIVYPEKDLATVIVVGSVGVYISTDNATLISVPLCKGVEVFNKKMSNRKVGAFTIVDMKFDEFVKEIEINNIKKKKYVGTFIELGSIDNGKDKVPRVIAIRVNTPMLLKPEIMEPQKKD